MCEQWLVSFRRPRRPGLRGRRSPHSGKAGRSPLQHPWTPIREARGCLGTGTAVRLGREDDDHHLAEERWKHEPDRYPVLEAAQGQSKRRLFRGSQGPSLWRASPAAGGLGRPALLRRMDAGRWPCRERLRPARGPRRTRPFPFGRLPGRVDRLAGSRGRARPGSAPR